MNEHIHIYIHIQTYTNAITNAITHAIGTRAPGLSTACGTRTPATPTQLIIRRHLWTMPNAYVFPNETRAAFGAARHDGDRDKNF